MGGQLDRFGFEEVNEPSSSWDQVKFLLEPADKIWSGRIMNERGLLGGDRLSLTGILFLFLGGIRGLKNGFCSMLVAELICEGTVVCWVRNVFMAGGETLAVCNALTPYLLARIRVRDVSCWFACNCGCCVVNLTTGHGDVGEGTWLISVPELEVDRMEEAESDWTLLARDSVDRRLTCDAWTIEWVPSLWEDETDTWSKLSMSLLLLGSSRSSRWSHLSSTLSVLSSLVSVVQVDILEATLRSTESLLLKSVLKVSSHIIISWEFSAYST